MALHTGKLLTKPNQLEETQNSVQYLPRNPQSSDVQIGNPSNNVGTGILPPQNASKIPDIHANGLVGCDSRQYSYPYSNYANMKGVSQNVYSRGPAQTVTMNSSRCSPSDGLSHVRLSWPNNSIGTFRPNTLSSGGGGGHCMPGSTENQERVFSNCDANDLVLHDPTSASTGSSFQTLGVARQAVYMVGPKPTTVLSEAGGQEHLVKISQSAVLSAEPGGCSTSGGAAAASSSSTRRQYSEKCLVMKALKEVEMPSPSDGNSVMSTTSLSSAFGSNGSMCSINERLEKMTSKKTKSNSSFPYTSLTSDCEVEPAASTTTVATAEDEIPRNSTRISKDQGEDSSSREVVSSSTAVGDTFGGFADSSTTVERKTTKKQSSKVKPGVNVLGKIASLGTEPDRQQFLEKLFAFMEFRGTPISTLPVICRQAVDLYRLYHLVKERDGMVEVSKGKRWRDVSSAIGIGGSTSAGFTLKRNYGRYLFPYECKFDRGDVDPVPLLAAMETPSRKDSRRKAAEKEKERDIEMDESQSSCSHLATSGGQPSRNAQNNSSFLTIQNWPGYASEHMCNEANRNTATPGPGHSSSQQPSSEMMMLSGSAGYQMGNQPSTDSTRPSGLQSDPDQKSEYGVSNSSYALHSLQTIRPSGLPSDVRGLHQNTGDYVRIFTSSSGEAESSITLMKSTNEEGLRGAGFQLPALTDGFSGGQVKDERVTETSFGISNIPEETVTCELGGHLEAAGNERSPQLLASGYPAAHTSNMSQLNYEEARSKGLENRPSHAMCQQVSQGNTFQHSGIHGGAGDLGVPGSSSGSACNGNWQGELSQSSAFGHRYQNFPERPYAELASNATGKDATLSQDKQPSMALQKNQQFHKTESSSLSVSRCEMVFPSGSVEAKQPIHRKRKILTHKDIGPIDPWQIMMSLRSGLISESTWALDVLSVLLRDDFTASAFCLSNVPGLLEVLVEHLRRYLIEIFGAEYFGDLEMVIPSLHTIYSTDFCLPTQNHVEPFSLQSSATNRKRKLLECEEFSTGNLKSLSNDIGFTPHVTDVETKFATDSCQILDWQMGHGDTTVHIITRFGSGNTSFHKKRFFGANLNTLRVQKSKSGSAKVDLNDEEKDMVTDPLCSESTDLKTQNTGLNAHIVDPDMPSIDSDVDHQTENVQLNNAVKDNVNENNLGNEVNRGVINGEETAQRQPPGIKVPAQINCDDIRMFSSTQLESLRRMCGDVDEDVEQPDHSLILCCDESKIETAKRGLCIANIIRNLSLISGNGAEMARHRGLVLVLSRLLMLHHTHRRCSNRNQPTSRDDAEDEDDGTHLRETLANLREHSLVVLASISGQLDLSLFPESICLPLLDSLLHWSICQSAEARDPLPGSTTSIGHLVLETLCKLCITGMNVDLLIATPPFSRVVLLLSHLANLLSDQNSQVVRELSLGLMSRIVQTDNSAARAVALERSAISYLLEFIEGAEHQARMVAKTQGIETLQDFPETIGTSVDMLCRAAGVLRCLALIPANSSSLVCYQHRFLQLIMSQILDCKVTAILAEVLGIISST